MSDKTDRQTSNRQEMMNIPRLLITPHCLQVIKRVVDTFTFYKSAERMRSLQLGVNSASPFHPNPTHRLVTTYRNCLARDLSAVNFVIDRKLERTPQRTHLPLMLQPQYNQDQIVVHVGLGSRMPNIYTCSAFRRRVRCRRALNRKRKSAMGSVTATDVWLNNSCNSNSRVPEIIDYFETMLKRHNTMQNRSIKQTGEPAEKFLQIRAENITERDAVIQTEWSIRPNRILPLMFHKRSALTFPVSSPSSLDASSVRTRSDERMPTFLPATRLVTRRKTHKAIRKVKQPLYRRKKAWRTTSFRHRQQCLSCHRISSTYPSHETFIVINDIATDYHSETRQSSAYGRQDGCSSHWLSQLKLAATTVTSGISQRVQQLAVQLNRLLDMYGY